MEQIIFKEDDKFFYIFIPQRDSIYFVNSRLIDIYNNYEKDLCYWRNIA